jgi:hypothetical protein
MIQAVGDVASANAAVEAPPHAAGRHVALGVLLNETLNGKAR